MSRIKLSGGYTVIPEGTHVFQITEVNYNETFGKLEVKMITEDGETHVERFGFIDKSSGAQNQGAINAFSFFARIAMDDITLTDIDPQDLVGHFIEADVYHDKVQSRDNPNTILTFAKLGDKRPSSGFPSSTTVDNPAPVRSASDALAMLADL